MINDDDDLIEELVNDTEPKEKKKPRRYKSTARARTIAPKELLKAFKKKGNEPVDETLLDPSSYDRPEVRGDCLNSGVNAQRPCPFVSCEHHLYIDVNKETGAIKMNFPHLEVWEMQESCSLDVADKGGITLEEVGAIMNLTRERIRQVEVWGLKRAGFVEEVERGCKACGCEMEEVENLDHVPGKVFACTGCEREIKEIL